MLEPVPHSLWLGLATVLQHTGTTLERREPKYLRPSDSRMFSRIPGTGGAVQGSHDRRHFRVSLVAALEDANSRSVAQAPTPSAHFFPWNNPQDEDEPKMRFTNKREREWGPRLLFYFFRNICRIMLNFVVSISFVSV